MISKFIYNLCDIKDHDNDVNKFDFNIIYKFIYYNKNIIIFSEFKKRYNEIHNKFNKLIKEY